MLEEFVEGTTYSYKDINREIEYPPNTILQKAILYIPNGRKDAMMLRIKEDVEYYDDEFDPDSDILYYIGQGKPEQRHPSPKNGNKRIIESENKNFYLFAAKG